jgi:hypothetical protein
MLPGIAATAFEAGRRMGLTARQIELNRLFAYYRCENYDHRAVDWDGAQRLPKVETEFVATAQYVPPGFYDAGQTMPLKFRRPTAPHYLVRMIVKRFTAMLFSSRRHPSAHVLGDADTEDWLSGVLDQGQFWKQCAMARDYGGATGSACIGFKVVSGEVQFEVHDPRLTTPIFRDPQTGELDAIDKRYIYTDFLRAPDGSYVEARFWYRRLIDRQRDTVWPKVPVLDDQAPEPDWDDPRWERVEYEHGFGEVPCEWIQNSPVQSEIDGDADCHGAYDKIEELDRQVSQALRGTIANCDPTVHIASDEEFSQISKGSGNAIKTEKGGSVSYLEITAAGIQAAWDAAERLERQVLEHTRCVLDLDEGGPQRTATEIDRRYSSFLAACDELRQQYGAAIKRLLEKLLRAARKLTQTTRKEQGEDGVVRLVRSTIVLPDKEETDPKTGEKRLVRRELGKGEQVVLSWPPYFQPSLEDIQRAVAAAGMALASRLIDEEAAARFIAPYFGVKDVSAMLSAIRAQAGSAQAKVEDEMMRRMQIHAPTPKEAEAAAKRRPPMPSLGLGGGRR